ncbi:MAG: hypothetical protein PHU85_05025, partial [Phycisphaerae bacterium]|nr:hypothetical protein [Phycisphaerae bacterium]
NIFAMVRLRPGQFRTVADRRFGDAEALRDTRRNDRANGAMYLGGFVIECLLKAKLMELFPWLQHAGSAEGRPAAEQRLVSLCHHSHNLDEILARLPEVEATLSEVEQRTSNRLVQWLKSVCAGWTVHARYSPYNANSEEARVFLDKIKELRKWLL